MATVQVPGGEVAEDRAATPAQATPAPERPADPDIERAVADYLSNPIDEVVNASDPLQLSVGQARKVNPDFEAEMRRLSAVTGVPLSTARNQPDAVREQAQVLTSGLDGLTDRAPATADFLSVPDNAAVAHDQVSALERIEGLVKGARGIFNTEPTKQIYYSEQLRTWDELIASGEATLRLRAEGSETWLHRTFGDNARRSDARIRADLAEAKANRARLIESFQASQKRVQDFMPDIENPLARWTYGGLQSLVQTAPAVALGVATRNPLIGVGAMGAQSRAQQYGEVRARGGSPEDAAVSADLTGMVEAGTEMLPMGFLVKKFGETGFKAFVGGLLARELPSEQVATLAQDAIDTAIANPDKTWAEYWTERPEAAAATAVATLLQSSVIGGASTLLTPREKTPDAETAAEAFDALAKEVQANPLAERSPEALAKFLDGASGEGQVFVPAAKVAEFFQARKFDDPDSVLDDWNLSEQLPAALAADGDVVFDMGEYLTKVAPEAHAAFRNDLRLSAETLSVNEAKTFDGEAEARLEAAGAEVAGQVLSEVPAARVFADVYEQAVGVGYTPDAARQYATLWASRYTARAERAPDLYPDAWAAYQASGVRIQEDVPAELRGRMDRLDVLVNALRTRADPKANAGAGRSLLEFMAARGGALDDGGELSAMDADKWHKGKAFRRRLIRAEGDPSHTLASHAEAARDAGYIADGEEATLLEAVRQELSGKTVFSNQAETDPARDDFRTALDQLEEMLHRLGVDPATATDAEIKAAVEGASAGEGYEQSRLNTETPEFKAWFGDSKVVDAHGRPLVVYHGTHADFEAFDPGKLGDRTEANSAALGFFFSDRRTADSYANFAAGNGEINAILRAANAAESRGDWDEHYRLIVEAERMDAENDDPQMRMRGQNTIPAYLSISNPVEIDAGGATWAEVEDRLSERIATAKAGGHDGAIIRNLDDAAGLTDVVADHYVAFAPTQIKSVFNRGTFDPVDPRILYQPADGSGMDPRGRVSFSQNRTLITLFGQRDLSTLLHEGGHIWLEELRFDAQSSEQAAADLAVVESWWARQGIADPEEQHEVFARGAEAYLMESKAPSPSLREVFSRFKAWLVSIYRAVSRLNAPITDEMRGVFDRLIASDAEIEAAAQMSGAEALFTDAAAAGMTEAEYAAYQASVAATREAAKDEVLAKVMATLRRQRAGEFREEVEAMRPEIEAQVDASPDMAAMNWLRQNRASLSREGILSILGDESALALLPKSVPPLYVDRGGIHPDNVAEVAGYPTGEAMLLGLMDVARERADMRARNDNRSVRAARIETEIEARIAARHGDPLNDGSLEREALDAIHSEKRGEVLAAELRALGKATGTTPAPMQVMRAWAERTIAGKRVRDAVRPEIYLRTERKAANAAQQAAAKGDAAEAFKQKQAQTLNHLLYIESRKAAKDVDAAVKRMRKYAKARTMASMDQDYLEQIHGLLERFDFSRTTLRAADRRSSFAAFVAEKFASGEEIAAPPGLLDDAFRKPYVDMTMDELRGLNDAVRSVAHLGRLKQKLLDGQDARDFAELVAEGVDAAGALPPRKVSDNVTLSPWDKLLGAVRSGDVILLRLEQIFDWLDGGNPNGPFNRLIFRRLADAQANEQAMLADYTKRLDGLLRAIPKEQMRSWMTRVVAPGLTNPQSGRPLNMTKDALIAAALNTGNESNKQKLLDGWGWDEAALQEAFDRYLTKADWDYVQGVWDTINSLWPQMEAMQKRVSGIAPPKIEASPVQTPFGEYAGGYYPVAYDPRFSRVVEKNAQRSSDQLFENIYTRATTRSGSTRERVSFEAPIHLSLAVMQRHVGEVIHDLSFREAIMDADRYLANPKIEAAIESVMGREVVNQFRPWLQNIANEWAQDRRGLAFAEALFKHLRTSTTIMGLGYRLSTVLVQPLGLSNSTERVGERAMVQGLATFATNPVRATVEAMERSAELPSRFNGLDRDLREAARSSLGKKGLVEEARRFAYYGIGYADLAVAVPTWWAGYHKALREGMSEEDAAYFADKVVRQSQGAGAVKDLAAVQRGSEYLKIATVFYSYFSAYHNRVRNLGRDYVRSASQGRVQDLPLLLARTWWLTVLPSCLSALLSGNGPDEDENWGEWAFRQSFFGLFMGIPLARDVAASLNSGYGYKFTPISRFGETLIRSVKDVAAAVDPDEEVSDKAMKNALESVGYIFKLPLGQAATSTQFLADVAEGQEDPEGVGDWYRGLTRGSTEEK